MQGLNQATKLATEVVVATMVASVVATMVATVRATASMFRTVPIGLHLLEENGKYSAIKNVWPLQLNSRNYIPKSNRRR